MPRLATFGCGMLITIFFITCIIQNSFSAHLGRFSMQRRSIDSSTSQNADTKEQQSKDVVMPPQRSSSSLPQEEMSQDETATELPYPSQPLDLSFGARLPQPSTPNVNLFEEYMSRGLYTCTSSYLDALGKLHALIAEVYADYQNCQKLIKTTPKTFSRTDIDALDDMLDEWEKEDAAAAVSASTTKTEQQGSQEAERREEDIAVPATASERVSETTQDTPQILP
jgi:hypothetical protein|uniref:Uncharacterized protein n=1 Tax=Panagrolaimus sp. PS1159 TaxID=55785 RepID=A0AC35G478_9BILA